MVTNKIGDLDGFLMAELTFFGISESVNLWPVVNLGFILAKTSRLRISLAI
jgi:hypothetical protein